MSEFEHREDLGEGAWVIYVPAFVEGHADRLHQLIQELPLRAEHIFLFGKFVAMPRLTSWHGDRDAVYAYSGRHFSPAPWTAGLLSIRQQLVSFADVPFNSVLANYYRDGRDSMGAHSDNEPELGPSRENIVIASVSLGALRRFVLGHRRRRERREYALGEGALLLMGGTTQKHFRHWVPKTKEPVAPRLNLTFRLVFRPIAAGCTSNETR